jgi:hypothetical protein
MVLSKNGKKSGVNGDNPLGQKNIVPTFRFRPKLPITIVKHIQKVHEHETISGLPIAIKEQMKQKLNLGNQAAKIRDSLVVYFNWFCILKIK